MSRAVDLYEKNLEKPIDVILENIPKDMAFFIYIYVRDRKDVSEDDPDGKTITCHAQSQLTILDYGAIETDIKNNPVRGRNGG